MAKKSGVAKKEKWYVYIIECQNGRYYTGITKNVAARFEKHQTGKGAFFTKRNPVKEVIFTEIYDRMGPALKREAEIKRLTRAEKEIIIKSENNT